MTRYIMHICAAFWLVVLLCGVGEAGEVRDGYWDAYHQCIISCAEGGALCMDKCADSLTEKDNANGAMRTCLDIHKDRKDAYAFCREHLGGGVETIKRMGRELLDRDHLIYHMDKPVKPSTKRIWTYSESGVTPTSRPPMQSDDECYVGWNTPKWENWLKNNPGWEEDGMGSLPDRWGGQWIYMRVRRGR